MMWKNCDLIGYIIGLFGIVLSIYFYISGIESKELSYNSYLDSYKIYDQSINSTNKISLYKGDARIEQNVYLTTFAIWNSGDLPIEPGDIRDSLEIKFNGVNQILDIKITKEIQPGISKFKLARISNNKIKLNWKYFDPSDGIKFQIIYTGNPTLVPTIEGKILKTEFVEFKSFRNDWFNKSFLWILPLIFLFLLIYGFILIKRGVKKLSPENNKGKVLKINVLFGLIILYAVMIPVMYYLYFFAPSKVPF